MTKTLTKSRCKPKYKTKLQAQVSKDTTSTNFFSNLQNSKNKIFLGSGFIAYI